MTWRVARTTVVLLALVAVIHSALVWHSPLLRSLAWDVIQHEAGKFIEALR